MPSTRDKDLVDLVAIVLTAPAEAEPQLTIFTVTPFLDPLLNGTACDRRNPQHARWTS
jgi:hypothetical protein